MKKMKAGVMVALLFVGVFISAVAVPQRSFAVGSAADAICVASQCTMTPTQGHPLCSTVKCTDVTNKFSTTGMCATPSQCLATATSDNSLGDLAKLMGALAQMMQALKGSGSGEQSSTTSTTCTLNSDGTAATSTSTYCGTAPNGTYSCNCGCSQFYSTTDASSTDICAYYLPTTTITTTSGTTTTTTSSTSNTSTTTTVSVAPTSTPATSGVSTQSAVPTNSPMFKSSTSTAVQMTPGVSGNIVLTQFGATMYILNQDTANNKAIAGMYGGDVPKGQQPSLLVAKWCLNRPWSVGSMSTVIPPSFFDGLCTWAGLKVGTPPPTTVTVTETHYVHAATAPAQPAATSTGSVVPPKVQIWAVPTKVTVGSRTSIFWSTQGVTSCSITSPDGSFNEHALSGGSSTVPLTTATTYTISCQAPDGTPVTSYVTVNMAI